MAYIGYIRATGNAPELQLQIDALTNAGCTNMFRDDVSGRTLDRPGWSAAMTAVQEGDVVVVWRLDRLGRSLGHLIGSVNELAQRRIGFRSLTEALDTTGPNGRFILDVFASLGNLEQDLIRERTRPGLIAAISSGRQSGRKPVITEEKLRQTRTLLTEGFTVREIAARLDVSKTALYVALRTANTAPGEADIAAPMPRRSNRGK